MLYISNKKESAIKWAKVVIISPNLVSIPKIIVLFDCANKKKQKCIVPIVFYCSLLFVNNRTIGISKNRQRGAGGWCFILFLEINHQNKYSDQVSWSYLHFYGNYRGVVFWSKMTSFFAQKWVIAPQAKIVEVWKLSCKHVLWVYTCI